MQTGWGHRDSVLGYFPPAVLGSSLLGGQLCHLTTGLSGSGLGDSGVSWEGPLLDEVIGRAGSCLLSPLALRPADGSGEDTRLRRLSLRLRLRLRCGALGVAVSTC